MLPRARFQFIALRKLSLLLQSVLACIKGNHASHLLVSVGQLLDKGILLAVTRRIHGLVQAFKRGHLVFGVLFLPATAVGNKGCPVFADLIFNT